eukprot:351965-Chlamydomonas_euryale.AAC.22
MKRADLRRWLVRGLVQRDQLDAPTSHRDGVFAMGVGFPHSTSCSRPLSTCAAQPQHAAADDGSESVLHREGTQIGYDCVRQVYPIAFKGEIRGVNVLHLLPRRQAGVCRWRRTCGRLPNIPMPPILPVPMSSKPEFWADLDYFDNLTPLQCRITPRH